MACSLCAYDTIEGFRVNNVIRPLVAAGCMLPLRLLRRQILGRPCTRDSQEEEMLTSVPFSPFADRLPETAADIDVRNSIEGETQLGVIFNDWFKTVNALWFENRV